MTNYQDKSGTLTYRGLAFLHLSSHKRGTKKAKETTRQKNKKTTRQKNKKDKQTTRQRDKVEFL